MIRSPRAAAILVAAASAAASAQFTGFAPRVDLSMTAGYSPTDSVLTDLDNDGDLDIACPAFTTNSLDFFAVYLGNGDGTFAAPTYVRVGDSPIAIIAADVNLDNKMDLLTANRDTNDFSLRLGNGDGTFQNEAWWSTGGGSGPQDLTSADFNDDGLPDIAVCNGGSDSVSVFFGDGAGGFTLDATYTTHNQGGQLGSNPRGIDAADLNFDGHPEIITANTGSSHATVFYNIAAAPGAFFWGEFGLFVPTGPTPFDVEANDHDNDGDIDLIFAEGNTVTRRYNEYHEVGGLTFPLFTTYSRYSLTAGSRLVGLCTADFDDLETDGDDDIIVADEVNNRIAILMNNGSGGVSWGGAFDAGPVTQDPSAGDLDGDGDIDVVAPQFHGAAVGVFLNKTSIANAAPPVVRIDAPGAYGSAGGCVCAPTVTIAGVAYSPDDLFDWYSVSVRPVSDPDGWVALGTSPSPVAEPGATLATWNAGAYPEGFYLINVTAENLAGNRRETETVVWLSQNYNTLNTNMPSIVGSTACITGTANDDGCGPNGYTVDYRPAGGGAYTPVNPASPNYSGDRLNQTLATWDTIGLGVPDGLYEIRVEASNGCGQTATQTFPVTVDNTSPVAVITDPAQCDFFAPAGTIPIRGTASDANLDAWSLHFTGGPYNSWKSIASGNTNIHNNLLGNWDVSDLPPCAYTIRLIASDAATLNCNGVIDHDTTYLVSVNIGCRADLAEPYNLLDLADVLAFVESFNAGCP